MKKIPTLFAKDPNNLGRVIDKPHPEAQWLFEGVEFDVYRKLDGSSCAIIDKKFYKRYDAKLFKRKRGKIVKRFTIEEVQAKLPKGAIPCQDPDEVSGHWPHWVPVDPSKQEDKWFHKAYMQTDFPFYSINTIHTFEAVGPHFNGNNGGFERDFLCWHKDPKLKVQWIRVPVDFSFLNWKNWLEVLRWEGVVLHERNGDRMVKIRRSDFGFNWPL